MDVPGRTRTCVLVAAAGAPWEATAIRALERAGLVVLKRCVDLPDLLGTASSGQAQIAVLAPALPGLDSECIRVLEAAGVRTLSVAAGAQPASVDRMLRLGVEVVDDVDDLPSGVAEAAARSPREAFPAGGAAGPGALRPTSTTDGPAEGVVAGCRRIAVWGPTGAPGRTIVAASIAALRAERGHPAVLIDADPYGGAVAQQLGVLDEVSGLLSAARLANDGTLDAETASRCRRSISARLDVVTGLPRPDRWFEVREGVVESLVTLSAQRADVVVDCGFSLEELGGTRPPRNTMTLEALACADQVVVVGSAEPTALPRLARGLLDLAEVLPGVPIRVLVNRMRDGLGWKERDVVGMVEGYAGGVPVHFLPEDRMAVDRAAVRGRSLAEQGRSAFTEALEPVVEAIFGSGASTVGRGRRAARRGRLLRAR